MKQTSILKIFDFHVYPMEAQFILQKQPNAAMLGCLTGFY